MNTSPWFSIIVPTFNSAETLKRCLDSVASQSFQDFELLIMDGLSSDGTLTIAKEFENQLKLSISSQQDDGIYDAMNKGISKAKGKFLYFLGSDDTLFDENVLQHMAEVTKHTVEKIIYGNVKMQGESHVVKDGTVYGGSFDLKRLLNFNIPHQAIFYHRSVFEKAGVYNLNYKILADHDFNLRAMAIFNFYYVDTIVANFSVGGASTVSRDENFEQDKIGNFIKYYLPKVHTKPFIRIRYYLKKAALDKTGNISTLVKAYCLLVYFKLKLQSLIF